LATGRIGTTPVLTTRWSKAPAAGTTSLSGLDDNSVSLVYSVGYEQVYLNGALLSRTNDYTATNGTTITLTNATVAGDIVEVFANAVVPLTDTYTQTVANGKFINNTLTTTTGDIIYASAANTPARLAIGSTDQVLKVSGGIPAWGAAGSTLVGVQATLSSEQTISTSTYTAITFNTETAGFDTDSFHDNTTNNSRFTVPSGKGGYYFMIGRVVVAGASSTWNNRCKIRKNGSTDLAFGYSNASTTGDVTTFVSCVSNLTAGDYIEFVAWQGSGSNKNLQSNLSETGPTMFTMFKVGD
jgi:hypothetical protein